MLNTYIFLPVYTNVRDLGALRECVYFYYLFIKQYAAVALPICVSHVFWI